jgi:hypothetical protein
MTDVVAWKYTLQTLISDTGDIAQFITVTAITADTIGGKSVAEIFTAAASTGTANRLTRWDGNQI